MVIYECDRCHKQVSKDELKEIELVADGDLYNVDVELCESCLKAVVKVMTQSFDYEEIIKQ